MSQNINMNVFLDQLATHPDRKMLKYWKKIGVLLQLAVIVFAFLAISLPPLGILIDMDPFVHSFPDLFPSRFFCSADSQPCALAYNIIMIILRLVAGFICSIEGCRFCSIYALLITHIIELQITCIDKMHKISNYRKNSSVFKWYNALRIAYAIYGETLQMFMFTTMSLGYIHNV